MATLKDVAKLACVDVSTVSRALNDTSYVHPETKARILEAVKKLSYQPNVLARGLRQGKRRTIGVIVPSLQMSIFAGITQSIDREAQKRGYAILLCNSYDDPAIEKECLNRLRNGFVDGIIIASTGRNSRLIQDIRASGIMVVQIVREQIPHLNSIVADFEATAYEAVYYLHRLGSRSIALLGGNKKLVPFQDRYHGYCRAVQELQLPMLSLPGNFTGFSFEAGYQGTQDLLFEHPEIDAFIASVDFQGLGALRLLKEQGKRVPDDVRVICLTGHAIGALLETTMTAMELPAAAMGQNAVRMLVEDIESTDSEPPVARRLVFKAELVEREST